MANYFNPTSFNPSLDFRISGALGGSVAAEDRNRYNKLADMFQTGEGYNVAKKGIELDEYVQAGPQRALAGQAAMAKSRAEIETVQPKARAELMSLEGTGNSARLKAKMEEDTYSQKLLEAIAKSKAAQSDSEWSETLNNVKQAAVLQEAAQQDPSYSGEGPLPLSVTSRLPQGSKLSEVLMKAGPNAGKLLRIMSQLDPKHIQELAQNSQKETAAMERQRYSSDQSRASAKDVANISAAWHMEQIKMQREKQELIKQLETKLLRLTTKKATQGLSPGEEEDYRVTKEQWIFEKQAVAAAGLGFSSEVMRGVGRAAVPQPPSDPRSPGGSPTPPRGGPRTFASEQEALSSGYKGDAIINGRPARIE